MLKECDGLLQLEVAIPCILLPIIVTIYLWYDLSGGVLGQTVRGKYLFTTVFVIRISTLCGVPGVWTIL